MQVSRYEIRAHCRPPPEFKGERATTHGFCFGSVVFRKRAWTRWHRGSCVPGRAGLRAGCPWPDRRQDRKAEVFGTSCQTPYQQSGRTLLCCCSKAKLEPSTVAAHPGRSEGKGIPHPALTPAEAGMSQCLFVFPSEPLSHHPWERRA